MEVFPSKAPSRGNTPTGGISCLSLCLYGIRVPYNRSFLCMEATLMPSKSCRHSTMKEGDITLINDQDISRIIKNIVQVSQCLIFLSGGIPKWAAVKLMK